MNNMTFGQLLEKLLYLSNQKKSTLARELGYDVSYISKWINSKNLPTSKNITKICKVVSQFIVDSLTDITTEELINYFEVDICEDEKVFLTKYIERSLRESYFNTANKVSQNIHKNTHSEENYNSIMHINPRLRKKHLSNDVISSSSKQEHLDIIISTNLYNLKSDDKISIANMKSALHESEENLKTRVRFLLGFDTDSRDIVFDTLLIINMISMYPSLNYELYNCDVNSDSIMFVIKDKLFHSAVFSKDGRCLFTNMSKQKDTVDEMYYSLDDILKNQGNAIFYRTKPRELIEEKVYLQYIMGRELRLLMGSMNEILMPEDLFMEIGEQVFGSDEEIITELKRVNTFLQNGTYKSKLQVLVYESELRKYISSGNLNFFNTPVTLTLKQREAHMEYIDKILRTSENIEIKLVEGNFVEDFKNDATPSLYLSDTINFTKVCPTEDINDYAIIKDNEFKNRCDELFNVLWNRRKDIVIDDKNSIIERISNAIKYTKIINEEFEESI